MGTCKNMVYIPDGCVGVGVGVGCGVGCGPIGGGTSSSMLNTASHVSMLYVNVANLNP